MKYFVVADVHGYYDLMVAALHEAHFEPKNPNHCLISLGDAMDRGPQPLEVIKFLNSLPQKILIRGNHEDLLQDILTRYTPNEDDKSNGTLATAIAIAQAHSQEKISEQDALKNWKEVQNKAALDKDIETYYLSLIDYSEIGKFIFVHGWIPTDEKEVYIHNGIFNKPVYMPNWRELPSYDLAWYRSRWASGLQNTALKVFESNKTIVCGHWHAAAWHTFFDQAPTFTVFKPFISSEVIACDASTAYSGEINVIVIENDKVIDAINFKKDGKKYE